MRLGKNQIRAAHRATLSPTLSRRRERGQVAGCGINFCLTTAILTFMRTGCDRNLIFSNRNLATKILRTIQTHLIPPMDSLLRGNDGGEVFGVV